MTPCNVLQAPVLPVRIVKANPAGEMSQRLSSRPIRIVLVPGHYSAVMRRLAKELVMPEPTLSAQIWSCRNCECRMPQEIVKTGHDPPCAQSMEQYVIRITRLV